MPTLGTQTISSSFAQLLKTFTTGGLSGSLQVVTDGDDTSSALSLSTTGVSSTGSFAVDGASILTGAVTFGTSLTASTGTATIGTLFASGPATFGTSFTASTGTATIGTATISTATISSATIPRINGATTFATGFTSSTGTNTIGTIASTTISNTGLGTTGTLQVGASGPKLTAVSFGTAAFTGSTFQDLDSATAGSNVTTGTFAVTGAALGDIVFGGLTSIGSSTGTNATLAQRLIPSFRVESADTIRYVILNTDIVSHGTTPAGTLYATALRFTA
jgi:hypothetical protein